MSSTLSEIPHIAVTLLDFKTISQHLRTAQKTFGNQEALLSFCDGQLVVATEGSKVSVPAIGEWPGTARIFLERLLPLLKARSKKEESVRLSVRNGKLYIQSYSFTCIWMEHGKPQICLSLDPSIPDLIKLRNRYSDAELINFGIKARVENAEEKAVRMIREAAQILKPLEISSDKLVELIMNTIRNDFDYKQKNGLSTK